MAVHISEIGVRLVVGSESGGSAAEPARAASPPASGAGSTEEIVAECVKRVIEHLRAIEAR